jgi:hypothetical protein
MDNINPFPGPYVIVDAEEREAIARIEIVGACPDVQVIYCNPRSALTFIDFGKAKLMVDLLNGFLSSDFQVIPASLLWMLKE